MKRNAQVGIIVILWFIIALMVAVLLSWGFESANRGELEAKAKKRAEMVSIVRQAIKEDREALVQEQATAALWRIRVASSMVAAQQEKTK